MQVFKSFFKVLRKYIGQMIMYVGILCGVMVVFINVGNTDPQNYYKDKTIKYAVSDEDGSEMSRKLMAYLNDTQQLVYGVDMDERGIQDALYNRAVDCANDTADGLLEITTIPGSQASMLFETRLDSYMNMVSLYKRAGDDVNDADKRARTALEQKAEVDMAEGKTSGHSMLYNFYNYLGWVMICVMIIGVAPVLQVYNRKKLRARIECSSYKFFRLNRELVLGMMFTGCVLSVVFIVLSRILIKYDIVSARGGMFILNMLVYACVALSLAFLVSKLTQSEQILSMCANVISLGMAFLCGIFVPREFLSDTVMAIAHFLPAYWYANATDAIDNFTSGSSVAGIFVSMGVQVLFAVLFILVGVIVDRYKTAGRAMA